MLPTKNLKSRHFLDIPTLESQKTFPKKGNSPLNLRLVHCRRYHRSWIRFRRCAVLEMAIARCNYFRQRSFAATSAVAAGDVELAVAGAVELAS